MLRGELAAVALVALLHVALIRERLLSFDRHVGHVVPRHVRVLGNALPAARGRDVLGGGLLRRVDLVAIDAVLIAGSRLGGIQACLDRRS